jgi:trehalose 6-phosphate phosphatase
MRRRFAVFVDADTALLSGSPTQSNVSFAPYIPELLVRLHQGLEGAIALVSSGEIAMLDRLFAPHSFPAAGLYGCEIRFKDVVITTPSFSRDVLNALHDECLRFASGTPGAAAERMRCSVAISYPAAAEPQVWEFLHQMLANFGDCFSLRHRENSYEIVPAGYVVARAILELMQAEPFWGCLPIFIGADAVSETAFETVNHLGGSTIRVGQGGYTCAKQSVATPLAVHRLLAGFTDDFDWLVQQLNRRSFQLNRESEPGPRGAPLVALP